MNFTYTTLTEYLASKNTRTINMPLWFNKGIKFKFEFIIRKSECKFNQLNMNKKKLYPFEQKTVILQKINTLQILIITRKHGR